jgi:hypothetical protein
VLFPRWDAHLVMASWRADLPSPPSRRKATTPVIPSSPSTADAVVAPSMAGASPDGAACPGVVVLGVAACPVGDPGGGGLVVSLAAAAWWLARRRRLSTFFCF